MSQVARNLTTLLKASCREAVLNPRPGPAVHGGIPEDLGSHRSAAERFVRTIKESCLERIILKCGAPHFWQLHIYPVRRRILAEGHPGIRGPLSSGAQPPRSGQ